MDTLYFTGSVNNGLSFTGNGSSSQLIATGTVAAAGAQGPAGATGATGAAGTNGVGVPIGGTTGQFLKKNSGTDYDTSWGTVSGSGTVTSVAATSTQGVTASVTNPTTTPSIAIGLGAITPTSVAASGTVTGSNLSGTNTGNQTITLTGDVTGSGTGSFAATLATVNSNVGTFGSASQVPVYTVNAKGLTTATTNTAIQIAESQVTNLTSDLAGKLHSIGVMSTPSTAFTAVVNNKYSADTTTAGFTATLPATATLGDLIFIQKSDATANILTVSGNINGTAATNLPLRTQSQGKLFQWDGVSTWNVISGDISLASLDARYLQTSTGIAGYLTAGTNVSISGAGTTASPYSISASGGGVTKGYVIAMAVAL